MQEVVAANGEQVAVAADDCDRKFRVRELQANCEGDRTPVRGVERVQLHVARDPARATDPGDDDVLAGGDPGVRDCVGQAGHYAAEPTARTPDVRQPVGAQETIHRV